jgi:secreted PhoX family phosphatase
MRLIDRYAPIVVNDQDDLSSNPTDSRPIGELIATRIDRRALLKGAAASTLTGFLAAGVAWPARSADSPSTLTFEEIEHGTDETHHVAKGYAANVLIRWGDKVAADAPAFEAGSVSATSQEKQFGYNNDFIAFLPLPVGSSNSENGLLCVNHEYTNAELMFPGLTEKDKLEKLTKDQVEVEMAAHGHAVVEIKKQAGKWAVVDSSSYNRRISLSATKMTVSGPAAGHELLKTSADPTGKEVIGTLNNCAGGVTPWGTVLICEENFNNYFGGDPAKTTQADSLKRYGFQGKAEYAFARFHDRFNLEKEPNEANRFGWVVEYDPYEPASAPVKRTALGRFKHEGATTVLNKDGRVVVYTGDDERFDYLYKFVTAGTYNASDRAANSGLLDDGTLYVAQFGADGKLQWLPLVHGQGPLTAENGFNSQADVVIHARLAADKVGATPMDRPEDVEVNPVSGKIYAVMTNNSRRKIDQVDAANPRFDNQAGHIIELTAPGGEGKDADHAATEFAWDFFIIAGNPTWGSTSYGKGTSKNGWFAAPDNVAFDPKGRIWIATDQGAAQKGFGIGDGVYAADCSGDGRAVSRFFFRVPADAEMCGPAFTPDGKTLFLSVQHPGEGSTFGEPSTRWPDFADGIPPRPAVVAVTKDDGGDIGA